MGIVSQSKEKMISKANTRSAIFPKFFSPLKQFS